MSWSDKTTVKKGDQGERLVDEFLRSNNVVSYRPVFDGAHPFDRMVASHDKKNIFLVDVKTKAMRNSYPDTGIDIRHCDEYKFISIKYNLDVYLFFVDENSKEIYGERLSYLLKPRIISHNGKILNYPMEVRGIIYFPREAMKTHQKIDQHSSDLLKSLSTRNYSYSEAA